MTLTFVSARNALISGTFALLSATASASPQDLCPGVVVDPVPPAAAASGLSFLRGSLAAQGDSIAFPLRESVTSAAAAGGAGIFRITAASGAIVPVDSMVAPSTGFGFAAYPFGIALASSGAVLLARKEPLPLLPTLTQLRRVGAAGALASTVLNGSNPILVNEGWQRFDSDGDRAVLTTTTEIGGSGFVVLDFFAVDSAGDWFLEDSVRGPRVGSEYGIFDASIRGDRVVLHTHQLRVSAWERSGSGTWRPLQLPAALDSIDAFGAAIDGNTLVTTHSNPSATAGRTDIYDQLPSGQWVLASSIPYVGASSFNLAPLRPRVSGDVVTFEVIPSSLSSQRETHIYRRRTASITDLVIEVPAPVIRLSAEHAFLAFSVAQSSLDINEVQVVELASLVPGVRLCEERGEVLCSAQRAGDFHYVRNAPAGPLEPTELVLTGAPASRPALLLGSTQSVLPAGQLDSLCFGASGQVLRPSLALVNAAGSASWSLMPATVELQGGVTSNLTGTRFVFQALVRTPVGAASTRAVEVTL